MQILYANIIMQILYIINQMYMLIYFVFCNCFSEYIYDKIFFV